MSLPPDFPAPDRRQLIYRDYSTVADIAEPLRSFEYDTPAERIREAVTRAGVRVIGLRRDGLVTHYMPLDGGATVPQISLRSACVLDADAGLITVVRGLDEHPAVFVRALGTVVGVVQRRDLLKPPVRTWIFGLISAIEMTLDRRLANRDGSDPQPTDGLSLADKGRLTAEDPGLRAEAGFASADEAQQHFDALTALREELAHARDFVTDHWPTLIGLVNDLDRIASYR